MELDFFCQRVSSAISISQIGMLSSSLTFFLFFFLSLCRYVKLWLWETERWGKDDETVGKEEDGRLGSGCERERGTTIELGVNFGCVFEWGFEYVGFESVCSNWVLYLYVRVFE